MLSKTTPAKKKATDTLYLECLSEQLAQFAGAIIAKRLEFLAELEALCKRDPWSG